MAIWGTPPDSIDDAEDRDKWYELLTRLDIRQPPGGMVTSEEGALAEAAKLGYPVRRLFKPYYLGFRVFWKMCSGLVPGEQGALAEAAKLGYPVRQLTPILGCRIRGTLEQEDSRGYQQSVSMHCLMGTACCWCTIKYALHDVVSERFALG